MNTAVEIRAARRRAPTPKQAMILDWISKYVRTHGYPPTLREIGAAFGIRSTNGVNDHLRALERKGYLKRTVMASRGLVVTSVEGSPIDPMVAENARLRQLLERVVEVTSHAPVITEEMASTLYDVQAVLQRGE